MAIAGWWLAIAVGVGPITMLVLDALQSFIPVDWNEPVAN